MNTPILKASDTFPLCARTRALIELIAGTESDTITDEALQQAAGCYCGPGGPGYHNLQTAIKQVRETRRQHWMRVPRGHCIKRRSVAETLEDLGGGRKRLHRQARRQIAIANIVHAEKLPLDERSRLAAEVVIGHCVASTTVTSTAKRLAHQAEHAKTLRELALPLIEWL